MLKISAFKEELMIFRPLSFHKQWKQGGIFISIVYNCVQFLGGLGHQIVVSGMTNPCHSGIMWVIYSINGINYFIYNVANTMFCP